MNTFTMIVNFEDGGFVTRAATLFADEFDVGEKLHFDGDGAVALTGFAAAAGDVEGKMAGGVAAALGVGRVGKDFADGVEGFHVGGGIRTRGAADGRLVDDDDFLDEMVAFETIAELFFAGVVLFCGERAEDNVVHERGFSGTADAGDDGEDIQRNHEVDVFEIVHGSAEDAKKFSIWLVADIGNRYAQFAAEIFSSERLLIVEHVSVSAGKEELAAEVARARAEIDDVACSLNGVGIVLDDEDSVAEVAKRLQNLDEALRVARVEADGWLIENVERADEMRAERRGELDALRFAAGESGGETVEGEVVKADFVEELEATANFFEDFVGDGFLHFGKLQRREKDARFFYGEFADFGDGFVCDANGTGFGAQARAAAIGTRGVAAIATQENADVEFVF